MVTFEEKVSLMFGSVNWDLFFIKTISFLLIIIFGILIAKLVSKGLKRLYSQIELQKYIQQSFFQLFVLVIRWSIYLLFFGWAINQLEISSLSNMFANFIIVIPAFTASLIILGIGLTVAFYLRQSIEDSEVTGWKFISLSFFYFILFVVGIYSLRTALVILKETSLQYILVGYSIIFFVSVAFFHLKNFKA